MKNISDKKVNAKILIMMDNAKTKTTPYIMKGPYNKRMIIVHSELSQLFTLKEAVLMKIVSVSKEQMRKLFTEEELKEMNYKPKEDYDNT